MNVLELLCGLALFLYGMDVMGDSLKKSAGSSLKTILGKMTSSPVKGFFLGLGVTAIIQSSSATTVMVVGFVNSGTMTLLQSVGVIMGANVGTAVTSWLTGLSGVGDALKWLKPDSWIPFVAMIGICLIMFVSRGKKRDIGFILIGFAVLMVGMDMMSGAVSGLKDDPEFAKILLMFENPILGVLAGTVLTAIVQSSSASVGILQSLTTTGAITFSAAIPIIMGQNIGTCVTAMLSSLSANKNGKRAALIHLYFNIIGVVAWLSIYYIFRAIIPVVDSWFAGTFIDMWGVAAVHTVFKALSVALIAPFYKQLEKLAVLTIKDKEDDEDEKTSPLDERLLATPSVAVTRATEVTGAMATVSCKALRNAISVFENYDPKLAEKVRKQENKADNYEDSLGTYLIKIAEHQVDEQDSKQVTKLLHIIGDFERISDHAVNIVESAEEIKDKKLEFSEEAQRELSVLRSAVVDILNLTEESFLENNAEKARAVEPLEEVIDGLKSKIKRNHIRRLQANECTIEHGFILADLLNDFERVSDHCSNIAECVIEIAEREIVDTHRFMKEQRIDNESFDEKYKEYKGKYSI
jgi:phosphate:Na+ symporter